MIEIMKIEVNLVHTLWKIKETQKDQLENLEEQIEE